MNRGKPEAQFFERPATLVAPDLLSCTIFRNYGSGRVERFKITEVEAYCGEEDKACHASKGRTQRTEVMYGPPAGIYIYLIYGMYWMLNFVTEGENIPHAVLIRGIEGIFGPGRVGKKLEIDKSFYGESLLSSKRLWLEFSERPEKVVFSKRIGIDYAGNPWKEMPWRYINGNYLSKSVK